MNSIQKLLYTRLAAEPSTSKWLLKAMRTAFERDPVDAVRDCEVLLEVLTTQMKQVFAAARRSTSHNRCSSD